MTKNIYIFSGLGVDERVFQKIDFSGYSPTFIKWIAPYENETIEDYAKRLIVQIPNRDPILIGLSFGGIMAVEVAKQIQSQKVILIASAKTKVEIPIYFRIAGLLRIHKLVPASVLKHSNPLTNWFFGAETNSDKQLLKQILIETNSIFLRWALDKVARWKNTVKLKNIIHLHGTNDKILPCHFVTCDVSIINGGHLMTLNKSEELTKILRHIIEEINTE